jgi:hypothetical protein
VAQYVNETAIIGATGYRYSGKLGGVLGNVSLKETAGTACTLTIHGPDGDTVLAVAANGQRFRRNVRVDYFSIVGSGATLLVDISGPEEFEDPNYLTATISGTVTTTDPATEANTAATASNTALIAAAFALLPGGQIQKATNGGILTGSS